MSEKKRALGYLQDGYTCAVCKEESVLLSKERGVKPLLGWLEEKADCEKGVAADKVVGKAAAYLYVLLGVAQVHAIVMSEGAEWVFRRFAVEYTYVEKVPAVRNRTGDGFCPMEQAVLMIDEPEKAYEEIKKTQVRLKEKK